MTANDTTTARKDRATLDDLCSDLTEAGLMLRRPDAATQQANAVERELADLSVYARVKQTP